MRALLFIAMVFGGVLGIYLNCGNAFQSNAELAALQGNVSAPISSPSMTKAGSTWKPGEFRSIRVGTDDREKVLSILGKPVWSGDPFDEAGTGFAEEETRDEFEGVDYMYSRVAVASSKKDGRVLLIEASVPSLPLVVVLERFGPDHQRKTYRSKRCVEGDPDSEIMIEEDGPYSSVYYVYPNLGIAIAVDHGDRVNHVTYRSEPLASENAKCP